MARVWRYCSVEDTINDAINDTKDLGKCQVGWIFLKLKLYLHLRSDDIDSHVCSL